MRVITPVLLVQYSDCMAVDLGEPFADDACPMAAVEVVE